MDEVERAQQVVDNVLDVFLSESLWLNFGEYFQHVLLKKFLNQKQVIKSYFWA